MSYAAWSVIAGEQPTTSKWNILGTNDSSFNDGSGFAWGASAVLTASLPWTAYTPTIAAASGVFTAASATGRYQQIAKSVFYKADITITTVGSGSGCLYTLPLTAHDSAGTVGAAREDATTGNIGMAKLTSTTQASIGRYDNGNIASGGSGSVIRVFGVYEAA